MIRPGREWARPSTGDPDVEVTGGDADLAAAVRDRPGALVRFRPQAGSDLAGAVGLPAAAATGGADAPGLPEAGADAGASDRLEVALDLLRLDSGEAAVNMVVLGTPPDALGRLTRRFGANVRVDGRPLFHGPCTTVVVATGQFRRGLDLAPRGHPGDGRAEVQVYAVPGRERAALRARLATGTHVPHPGITQRSGARVTVSVDRRVACEIDGIPRAPRDLVDVTVVAGAYRLRL